MYKLCLNLFVSHVFSSYGSVFKAIHKESGQVVAIKQVPVESDLQEIIKEISIMQQCDRLEDKPAFSSTVVVWIIFKKNLVVSHTSCFPL